MDACYCISVLATANNQPNNSPRQDKIFDDPSALCSATALREANNQLNNSLRQDKTFDDPSALSRVFMKRLDFLHCIYVCVYMHAFSPMSETKATISVVFL